MSRKATITRDERGAVIATVPLGKKQKLYCITDLDSYQGLLKAGYSSNWNCYIAKSNSKAYVTLSEPGTNKTLMVSRVITKAGDGQRVCYIDGNPLHLRLSNLRVI